MSLGSSRRQANRGHMDQMLQQIRNAVSPPNHLQESQQYPTSSSSNFMTSPRTTQLTPLN